MGQLFIRYLFAPIGALFVSAIILAGVAPTGNTTEAFLTTYVLGFIVLTLTWWGTAFSRWLYDRYVWENVACIIANLVWALGIFGLSLSLAVGIVDYMDWLSILMTLVGLLIAPLWFIHSLYKIFSDNDSVYDSIHWLPLERNWTQSLLSLLNIKKIFENYASSEDRNKQTSIDTIGQSSASSFKLVAPPIDKFDLPTETSSQRDQNSEPSFRLVVPEKKENETLSATSQQTQNSKKEKRSSSVFRIVIPKSDDKADGSVAIPPRDERANTSDEQRLGDLLSGAEDVYRPDVNIQFSVSSSRSDFVSQAKKYVNRTAKKTEPVPFMQYWPKYDAMNRSQKRWYFYWRHQLRQGNWLPTDTSYLFVYIYEVINMVGFESSREAGRHLVNFWKHYRQLQPKLDNYLPDWIADFFIIHELPMSSLAWYSKVAQVGSFGDDDLLIEAWLAADGDFDTLSNDLIFRLADYDPTKSKFYKRQGAEVGLDAAYKQGLAAVDVHLRQETGQSLFAYHQPTRTRVIKRRPFVSALHGYPKAELKIATVHAWYGHPALSNAIRSIIKHTENTIREQNDYSYKLRDIDLKPAWETAIERAFTEAPPELELDIDLSAVQQLQQESAAVRERLLIADETTDTDSESVVSNADDNDTEAIDSSTADDNGTAETLDLDSAAVAGLQQDVHTSDEQSFSDMTDLTDDTDWLDTDDLVTDAPATRETTTTTYIERPANAPDDLLTDLAEVAIILGGSDSDTSTVVATLQRHDWQCTTETIQAALLDDGTFANVLIDTINERAFDEIGDALIYDEGDVWVIVEEYRDEIDYILDHPDYQSEVASQTDPTQKYAELDPEWAYFVDELADHHWEVLAAILDGNDVMTRADAIARRVHQTGNIVIDDINEIAYTTVGDLLIDTMTSPPKIIEDEQAHIADLINWAANRQLIEV